MYQRRDKRGAGSQWRTKEESVEGERENSVLFNGDTDG